jgi:hypothetical protein
MGSKELPAPELLDSPFWTVSQYAQINGTTRAAVMKQISGAEFASLVMRASASDVP